MGFLWDSFDAGKAKTNIKLACNRITLLRNKKAQVIDKQRREIANLLTQGKLDLSRVKAEHAIREQGISNGMDMLSAMADLLLARFPLVEKHKKGQDCVADIKELICTVIWAAPRAEIEELIVVSKQLSLKYGEELKQEAVSNMNNCVNEKIFFLFTYRTPTYHEVQKCLEGIAKEHGVAWVPEEEVPAEVAGFTPTAPIPEPLPSSMNPGYHMPGSEAATSASPSFPPGAPGLTSPSPAAACVGVPAVPQPVPVVDPRPPIGNDSPPPYSDTPAASTAPPPALASNPVPQCTYNLPSAPPPEEKLPSTSGGQASWNMPSGPPVKTAQPPSNSNQPQKSGAAAGASGGVQACEGAGMTPVDLPDAPCGDLNDLDLPDAPTDESEGLEVGGRYWYNGGGGGMFAEVTLVSVDRTSHPHTYCIEVQDGQLAKCSRDNLFRVQPTDSDKRLSTGGATAPDFDELEARLQALKGP